jgi:predicted Zn-dependent protease with MMP-like domain
MASGGDDPVLNLAVEQFFSKFDELLEAGGEAPLTWVDAAPSAIQELDDWVLCKADALLTAKGPQAAVAWLEAALLESPGFTDAHYRLAEIYELEGNLEGAILHHAETLRLDSASDELSGDLDAELLENVSRAAANAIAGLPAAFRARFGHVPILLDARPSLELIRDGYDSRSLGLFSGPNHGEPELGVFGTELTEIRLYVRCLWDAFGLDEAELLEQVRITVLHEIGHYFGLNEDELAELGLE